jgi:hypothetical protein
MPIPWLAALKIIPWASLLPAAPAIARAADTLLTGARTRQAGLASKTDVAALADRVSALERFDREDAELLKQMGDQIAALTTAAEVVASRQRWLLAGAGVAVVLSIAALGVAIAR